MKRIKLLQKLVPLLFLLIFIEIVLLQIRGKISLISFLEMISALLLTILYYFLIRTEFKMTSKELKNDLSVLVNRFDRIEDDLKEELKILSEEIKELKKTLKKKK